MKQKQKLKFKHNIFVKDISTGKVKGFYNNEEASEFIESHERPNDLICDFDKDYERRILK